MTRQTVWTARLLFAVPKLEHGDVVPALSPGLACYGCCLLPGWVGRSRSYSNHSDVREGLDLLSGLM